MSWADRPKKILKPLIVAAYRGRGYFPARIRGTPFRVNADHIGFWRQLSRGRWESDTFAVLERFLTPETDFIDVGAWIGPLSLFAATRSRRVFCIEPDPHAYRCLLLNLELNRLRNVVPFHAAVGARSGIRRMAVMDGRLGNSLTRLADLGQASDGFEVPGLSWSDWVKLANPGTPGLIKVDVEGAEFELLPAMKEYLALLRPPLLLSLHLPFVPADRWEGCLAGLREILALYRRCLDERMRPLEPAALFDAMRVEVRTVLLVD
jgi:FkbM family methyltransferase